ncbi:MAG TPA: AAA family ATPase [Mucilaginibacter sp.]
MKIELKNIGTVKQAEIDLDKSLLIFCGPNNSGKTYVAYTLYGLYKTVVDNLNNTIEIEHKHASTLGVNTYYEFSLSPHLVTNNFRERATAVRDNLENIFASNQYFFPESSIAIDQGMTDENINEEINKLTIKHKPYSSLDGNYEINKQTGTNTISIKVINNPLIIYRVDNFLPLFDIDKINNDCNLIIKQLFFGNAYIAPAERIAINVFSKELSLKRSGLLDPFSKDAKSRYSLPITDSLRIAEDLHFLSKNTSDYSFLAELFEEEILKGSISISQYGAMQFNPYDTNISELDIHLSGSMVKSLSSLVFYFRHLANKGDFIIIDEPELNLHPDNQIIMARILARIVNEGFKVLISTHSDYIITEINNLIRLNSAGEGAKSLIDKYGYKQADLIDKDMVGVYLFKDNKAIHIPVDEFGFEISTIQKENSRLAEISESIYFDLFDKEN